MGSPPLVAGFLTIELQLLGQKKEPTVDDINPAIPIIRNTP